MTATTRKPLDAYASNPLGIALMARDYRERAEDKARTADEDAAYHYNTGRAQAFATVLRLVLGTDDPEAVAEKLEQLLSAAGARS